MANDSPRQTKPLRAVTLSTRNVLPVDVGIVLAIGLLIRLAYMTEQGLHSVLFYQPLLDELELTNSARALLAGHGFGPEPLFKAPLYPILLAGVMAVSGNAWFWAIRLLQHAAGVALVYLVFDTTKRFLHAGKTRRALALGAAAVLAVCGPIIRLEDCINLDFFVVFFQSAMIWCLVRFVTAPPRRNSRMRWIPAAGILAGVSWLLRPTVTPVLPALALCVWFQTRRTSAALSFLVPIVLCMSAVACRNFCISKEVLVMPWQGGYNFVEANRPGANGRYLIQTEYALPENGNPTHELAIHGYLEHSGLVPTSRPSSYGSVDRFWFRRGAHEIASHPGQWLLLMLRKARDLTSDREIFNYEEYDVQKQLSVVLRWLPFSFGCLFPFAIASLATLGKIPKLRRQGAVVLWIYAACLACAIALYYTSGRLRMPLLFPALVLGASGIGPLLNTYQWSNRLTYAVLFTAGLLLSWGNWENVRTESHRAEEFARLSNAAFRDGKPQLALDYVQRAAADKPDYPTLPLLRGQALYQLGRHQEAAMAFRESLEKLPADPVAPFNLGVIRYYDDKNTTAAIASYHEALRRQPSYDRAAWALAIAYVRSHHLKSAEQVFATYSKKCGPGAPLLLLTAGAAIACAENDSKKLDQCKAVASAQFGTAGLFSLVQDLSLSGCAMNN